MLATVVVVAVVTPSWPAPLAGLAPPGPSAEGRGPRPTLPIPTPLASALAPPGAQTAVSPLTHLGPSDPEHLLHPLVASRQAAAPVAQPEALP